MLFTTLPRATECSINHNQLITAHHHDRSFMTTIHQFYTLPTIKRMLGHDTIDVLKMDIERAEFEVRKGHV